MESEKKNLSEATAPSNPPPYYPQDQPGIGLYPQMPAEGSSQPVTMVVPPPVGPQPARLRCPSCNADITTRLLMKPSTKTHLIALLLCALGCWLCCCIPYCVDSCQNAEHYCPSCNAYIGSYSN